MLNTIISDPSAMVIFGQRLYVQNNLMYWPYVWWLLSYQIYDVKKELYVDWRTKD